MEPDRALGLEKLFKVFGITGRQYDQRYIAAIMCTPLVKTITWPYPSCATILCAVKFKRGVCILLSIPPQIIGEGSQVLSFLWLSWACFWILTCQLVPRHVAYMWNPAMANYCCAWEKLMYCHAQSMQSHDIHFPVPKKYKKHMRPPFWVGSSMYTDMYADSALVLQKGQYVVSIMQLLNHVSIGHPFGPHPVMPCAASTVHAWTQHR